MSGRMPCHITDGPQVPEDVDHGMPAEPEFDKYVDSCTGCWNVYAECICRDDDTLE